MILDPERSRIIASAVALYLVCVVPVLSLGILILFIYRLLKNQLEIDHVIGSLISSILLVSIISAFF